MMGLTKQKDLPMPERVLEVVEARKQKEAAIQVQAEARAKRDGLRRILSNPNAPPAEKVRARLHLPAAETEVELSEIDTAEKQRVETVRLQEATQAWRPVFEGRLREALRGLYEAFDKHVVPANEEVRRVWLDAYSLGIELPVYFWTELLSNDSGGETLIQFRRRLLQSEQWL